MLNDPVVLVLGGSHLLINGLHISSGACKDLALFLLNVSSKERAATKNYKRVTRNTPDSTNNSLVLFVRYSKSDSGKMERFSRGKGCSYRICTDCLCRAHTAISTEA